MPKIVTEWRRKRAQKACRQCGQPIPWDNYARGTMSLPEMRSRTFCSQACSIEGRSRSPAQMREYLFQKSVQVPHSGCWLWQGAQSNGYGQMEWRRKYWRAHRASYLVYVGELDASMTIDHLCNERSCVNPAHLEQVSNGTNSARGHHRRRVLEIRQDPMAAAKKAIKQLDATIRELRAQLRYLQKARKQLKPGEYDDKLAKSVAQVSTALTRACTELRQLEAHEARLGRRLTDEEVDDLIMDRIRVYDALRRQRLRNLLDELDKEERKLLA